MTDYLQPDRCSVKKETESTLWTVLTSIGYRETELPVLENGKMRSDMTLALADCEKSTARYMYSGKVYDEPRGEFTQVCYELISDRSPKADAEVISSALEMLLALGIEDVVAEISADTKTYELLCLYGFEQYITAHSSPQEMRFKCTSGGKILISGKRAGRSAGGAADIEKILEIIGEKTPDTPGLSMVYAEKNAEGLGYDTAYNLRVNGCAVEFYIGDADADGAAEYAKKSGAECMLRVFADGRLSIIDLVKNTTAETTVNDFLGYEEEQKPLTPQQQGFRMF